MYCKRIVSLISPEFYGRRAARALLALGLALSLFACGCSRFHKDKNDVVYVSVQKKFLRDRVAAVSNRVAEVQNGQRLEVTDRWRRFLKVRVDKKTEGWIEEVATISSQEYDAFQKLADEHQQDPIIATGILRDDATLHLTPGRDTAHFYYLAANEQLHLFQRLSIPRKSKLAQAPKPATESAGKPEPEPEAALEDWWLVRNGKGHIGWLKASRIDVEIPDEVAVYGEGQRFVAAYPLRKVIDPEAATPNHEVTEYVTILAPRKEGLPFDFDQVRIFTWSIKRHRYETAYRLRPIQGFLPLTVGHEGPNGALSFRFQIAAGDGSATPPANGAAKPAARRTVNFYVADNVVRRFGADMAPIPTPHASDAKDAAKNKGRQKSAK